MLSRKGIEEELGVNIHVDDIAASSDKLGENYINVTLGDTLKVYTEPVLNIAKPNLTKSIVIPEEGYILEPNKLYLGRTEEFTKTYEYVPLLSGEIDSAVIGMEIHITAGFGDNGFEGTWTLEIVCANPTIVYPGMVIGRIYYYPLVGKSDIKYRGKYFGQVDPTESRMNNEYGEKGIQKTMTRGKE